MQVPKIRGLNREDFIEQYLTVNKPVVVCGAMDTWTALRTWTPRYLRDVVGDVDVQVYDDLFGLRNVQPLAKYLDTQFGRSVDLPSTYYVRGFSKMKDADFAWADEAFERLRDDWCTPEFLPEEDYVVPWGSLKAESSLLPYRGLFVSARGCRTRLHRDPWTSSAILCQVWGSKRFVMFEPDHERYLMDGDGCVDLARPDYVRFPKLLLAQPAYEGTLEPGEVLFVPSGWLHHVETVTDSISLTWNFVHASGRERLCQHIIDHPEDPGLEVLRYFLRGRAGNDASARELIHALQFC